MARASVTYHTGLRVPSFLPLLLIVFQVLIFTDVNAAFKTRIDGVNGVQPCSLSYGWKDPDWCNTPLNPLTDTVKLGVNLMSRRAMPDGTICAYHQGGRQNCWRCGDGRWLVSPCNHHDRLKRQVPAAKDISPYMLTLLACQLFCNGGSNSNSNNEANENAISPIYQLPAIMCPNVPGPIVAPPGSNATHVHWPMPQAHAPDGSFLFPVRVAGLGDSGHLFPEGQHTITYAAMDSTGFADTCSFSIEVKVIRCRMPEWPKYGNRSCEMGEMVYGTTCTFTCDPGYTLEGTSRITCMYDGTYDFPPPKCKANTCGALMVPEHGVLYKCTNHNYYGSVCILVCNTARGYKVSSQSSITTCLNTGRWSRPFPSCVDYMPPKFENCPETKIVMQAEKGTRSATVTWPDMVVRDNSEYARIQQVQGPPPGSRFKEGLNEIRYTAIDQAGNKAQPCSFSIVVEVPKCSKPSFGDRYMEATCPTGYEYGDTCELSCRMGVPLEGATSITCEIDDALAPNAFWDWGPSQAPVCKERVCDELMTPKHGAMACDRWAGGTLCQMQCNENYDVPRTVAISQHFVCASSTGKWKPTDKVPDCTELRRPKNMILPSELYYYAGDCGTSQTTELIKTQFVMSLQSSASWKDACTKDRNCNADNVHVECGPLARKRRHVESSGRSKRSEHLAALVTWDFSVDFVIGNMTVTEAINAHKDILKKMAADTKVDIQNGVFDLNVTGFELGQDSFAAGWSDFQCEKGQVSVYASASCAACPTGTYFNDVDCVPCPLGTFQDKDGTFECKMCPNGTRSLSTGAREASECKALCEPGTFSPTSSVPCSPCPHGFYQGNVGATSCEPCPAGTTTENTQNTDDTACTPYDVMIVGPTSFSMRKWLADDLGDFTITTWIKTNAPGAESTVISLVHPQYGHLLSLDLGATSSVPSGHGNISSTVQFPLDTWTHMAIVWYDWGKDLTIYVGGEPVMTQNFPEARTPLVTAGSTMTITTGVHGVVHIQGLLLLSSRRDADLIKMMSSTCTLPHEVALLSLDDIPKARDSSVLVITPSTCDAVDECQPDPCPGHTCLNGRDEYQCICHDDYTGENCTEPPNFCVDNICHGGSTCINEKSGYSCTCPPNFTDDYCQTEMIDVDGEWNLWTEWSTCSATCGGGWTVRMRECNNPPPQYNGAPCNGSSVEKKECNTEECPVCVVADLERGYGTRPRCTGDERSLTCTVSCRDGLMFVENPPLYQCTGGIWTPSKKIIPCTRIDNPERLELRFKGYYENNGCVDKTTANIMSQHLMSKTDQVTCVASHLCNMTAKVEPCPTNTRQKRSDRNQKIRLSVVLSVNMQGGELDLSYNHNYRDSPRLTSVQNAVSALERTALELKDSDFNAFSVDGPGGRYNVNSNNMIITPKVTCSGGFITRDAFCVGCPMGTRFSAGRCILCDTGTYQHEAGKTFCHHCTNGYTTHFRGSTHRHHCIRSEKEVEDEAVLDRPSELEEQAEDKQSPQVSEDTGPGMVPTPPELSQTEEMDPHLPTILSELEQINVPIPTTETDESAVTVPQVSGESVQLLPPTGQPDSIPRESSTSHGTEESLSPAKKIRKPSPADPEKEPVQSGYEQTNDIDSKAVLRLSQTDETSDATNSNDDNAVTATGHEGNLGTVVIAIVVTVCIIAVIIVIIFNFIVIHRRLKRDQSVEPPSWVWSFLHGSQLRASKEKTGGLTLGSPASTTSA